MHRVESFKILEIIVKVCLRNYRFYSSQ
jgi:hypothetical protein